MERVRGQRASKKCAATAEERCRHAAVDINTNHTLLQDEDTTLGSDKLNEELILRLLDTHTHIVHASASASLPSASSSAWRDFDVYMDGCGARDAEKSPQ